MTPNEVCANEGGITAVLFDFGGVLMRTVDPRPRRDLERRFGLELFAVDRLVFEHPQWDQAQLGHIGSDEVWSDIGGHLGLQRDGLEEFRERFWAGDQLDRELDRSLETLLALKGEPWLAYPDGAWDERVRQRALRAGYSLLLSIDGATGPSLAGQVNRSIWPPEARR